MTVFHDDESLAAQLVKDNLSVPPAAWNASSATQVLARPGAEYVAVASLNFMTDAKVENIVE
jgi:hypothetical protein